MGGCGWMEPPVWLGYGHSPHLPGKGLPVQKEWWTATKPLPSNGPHGLTRRTKSSHHGTWKSRGSSCVLTVMAAHNTHYRVSGMWASEARISLHHCRVVGSRASASVSLSITWTEMLTVFHPKCREDKVRAIDTKCLEQHLACSDWSINCQWYHLGVSRGMGGSTSCPSQVTESRFIADLGWQGRGGFNSI